MVICSKTVERMHKQFYQTNAPFHTEFRFEFNGDNKIIVALANSYCPLRVYTKPCHFMNYILLATVIYYKNNITMLRWMYY